MLQLTIAPFMTLILRSGRFVEILDVNVGFTPGKRLIILGRQHLWHQENTFETTCSLITGKTL